MINQFKTPAKSNKKFYHAVPHSNEMSWFQRSNLKTSNYKIYFVFAVLTINKKLSMFPFDGLEKRRCLETN